MASITRIAYSEGVFEALQIASLEDIKRLPKSELHFHLGGGLPLDFLESVSERQHYIELNQFKERIERGITYNDVFKVFPLVSKIVNADDKIRQGAIAICQKAREENITYLEIRTGLKVLDGTCESYLQAVLNGLKEGQTYYGIQTPLLLSLRRNDTLEHALETVELAKKYRDQGICGIDISGKSDNGDLEHLREAIEQIHRLELPFVLHLGESKNENRERQYSELILTRPKRIGHGVFLSEEAKSYIRENNIPLEICLTSSKLADMVEDFKDHPGLALYREGHPVCICSDDPSIFGVSLAEELHRLAHLLNLSIEAIQKLLSDTEAMRLKPSDQKILHS